VLISLCNAIWWLSTVFVRMGNKYLKTCHHIDLLILRIAGLRLCFGLKKLCRAETWAAFKQFWPVIWTWPFNWSSHHSPKFRALTSCTLSLISRRHSAHELKLS
jgi:hypothetical protein